MNSVSTIVSVLKKHTSYRGHFHTYLNYCTQNASATSKKNIEALFTNKEVQRILYKVTGLDYDKLFAPVRKPIEPTKYAFVTEKKLEKLQAEAAVKAQQKLQMPPVMRIREPINEILSKDPELQGYLEYKMIFTDISPSVSSRDRVVTVREVDGTLRKATWDERERMNQIFFPISGRSLETPKVFESPHLERLLDEGSYTFILDLTCAQFEPDSPSYHKVTSQTYEHIRQMAKFDVLRSTRHFGPMVFYFALKKDIDPLLLDMLSEKRIDDAYDTVKLLYLIHPEMHISKVDDNSDIVQDYIKKHASQKEDLQLALQASMEQAIHKSISE